MKIEGVEYDTKPICETARILFSNGTSTQWLPVRDVWCIIAAVDGLREQISIQREAIGKMREASMDLANALRRLEDE